MDMFNYELMKKLCSTFDKSYGVKIWKNGKLIYDSTKSNVSPKPNNNAPKTIKGDYDLSIHGNKIVLVENRDGTSVEAKCSPDDNFDIGAGIKEAFKKLNEKRKEIRKQKEEEEKKIKVGDWVEIVNWKMSYPLYSNFFSEHNLEDLGRNFRYGCYLSNGDKLQATHIEGDRFVLSRKEKIDPYGPQDCVYLMDIRGLKKVAKPNQ